MIDFSLKIGENQTFFGVLEENFSVFEPFWVNPDWYFNPPLEREYGNRNRTPAVFRAGEPIQYGSYVPAEMTEPIQLFQADLLSLSKFRRHFWELDKEEHDFIATAHKGFYWTGRAFTNFTGFDDNDPKANFVKREFLDYPLPKFHPLICATNTVYGKVIRNSQNREMVKIFAWETPFVPPTDYGIEILDDPRVMWATEIYKNVNPDGTQNVSPFDTLNEEGESIEVPYPFFVRPFYGYYPKEYLTPGSWAKYNPPR